MSIDKNTMLRVAGLASLELSEEELDKMTPRVAGILKWVEQLQEVNTDGVLPLTNGMEMAAPLREDVVTDGNCQDKVLKNAPEQVSGFFVVPKIVE